MRRLPLAFVLAVATVALASCAMVERTFARVPSGPLVSYGHHYGNGSIHPDYQGRGVGTWAAAFADGVSIIQTPDTEFGAMTVPAESAETLKDALVERGVLRWRGTYAKVPSGMTGIGSWHYSAQIGEKQVSAGGDERGKDFWTGPLEGVSDTMVQIAQDAVPFTAVPVDAITRLYVVAGEERKASVDLEEGDISTPGTWLHPVNIGDLDADGRQAATADLPGRTVAAYADAVTRPGARGTGDETGGLWIYVDFTVAGERFTAQVVPTAKDEVTAIVAGYEALQPK